MGENLIPNSKLLDLTGKTAIVTGGALGIGFGIALRLAEAGASVVIADLKDTEAKEACDKISTQGFSCISLSVDVSNEIAVKEMVTKTVETFGGIDILVNNAGIYPNVPLASMTLSDFEKVIKVNLTGVFLCTKYVSEEMKKNKSGKIINITSIDALHPSNIGLAHYDASKHGVWGFTKNSALELAEYNISVNAIAPGGILTEGVKEAQKGTPAGVDMNKAMEAFLAKIPMHRMGNPDDIAKVVLFLASDMSSYMTGEQIVVDGGVLLS